MRLSGLTSPEGELLDTNRLTEKNTECPRSITEWTTDLICQHQPN